MPASFWERDAAYRRRIGVIVPFVLTAYAILFFATDRIQYEDIPRFIGWKGELEVLPEITVLPELATIATDPLPNEAAANRSSQNKRNRSPRSRHRFRGGEPAADTRAA